VCCTVDAVLAFRTLDRHPEAARQIAMADHLFLTKTDLLGEPASQALLDCVRSLNPTGTVHQQREVHVAVLRQTMETRADDALGVSLAPAPAPALPGPALLLPDGRGAMGRKLLEPWWRGCSLPGVAF